MPLKEQIVLVKGYVFVAPEEGAHPEHPIYIPITPPPDSGLRPEHPIYFPVTPEHPIVLPPGDPDRPHVPDMGAHPEHPIYFPVDPPGDWDLWGGANEPFPTPPIYIPILPPSDAHPEHPIVLPPVPPLDGLTDEQKEALKAFLFGNLPPFDPPDYVAPVKRK